MLNQSFNKYYDYPQFLPLVIKDVESCTTYAEARNTLSSYFGGVEINKDSIPYLYDLFYTHEYTAFANWLHNLTTEERVVFALDLTSDEDVELYDNRMGLIRPILVDGSSKVIPKIKVYNFCPILESNLRKLVMTSGVDEDVLLAWIDKSILYMLTRDGMEGKLFSYDRVTKELREKEINYEEV